jgi:phosphoglycerol transferase MdoB-like AlkP superfamily enzyme
VRFLLLFVTIVTLLLLFFTLLRRRFAQHTPISIKLLLSMLFFGGVGFAMGEYFSEGWAIFGAIFGALVGIEYKEKLFSLLHLLYKDITSP